MLAQKALEEGGLRQEDSETVILPHTEQIVALRNKAIAAGVMPEPFVALAIQEGAAERWIPYYKYFNNKAQVAFVVFGPELAKNKDLAQRWIDGVYQRRQGILGRL